MEIEKIYHGDCIEVLNSMEGGFADLVVADPPYKMTKRGKSCRPNYMPDNMGDNVFEGELPDTQKWMDACYRAMKPNSQAYVFTNTISLKEYLICAEKSGLTLHNIISMIKDTSMPNRWYGKYVEMALFFRKGGATPINDMTSRDYFFATMPQKVKENKFHISQKPLDFISHIISNSTDHQRCVVMDPFMGSGTTGVVCKRLGLDFIGIEKEQKYIDIAKRRISGDTLLDELFS